MCMKLMLVLLYVPGASQCDEACVFRVAHNTISGIVHQTCKALYEVLWREHLQVTEPRMINRYFSWCSQQTAYLVHGPLSHIKRQIEKLYKTYFHMAKTNQENEPA